MTAGDERRDPPGGGLNILAAVHTEEDLFEIVGTAEVPPNLVRHEERVVADLGRAKGVDTFGEDADDGEGDATDRKSLTDGSTIAAVKFNGHGADDIGDIGVSEGVLVVEEATGLNFETANILVLRANTSNIASFVWPLPMAMLSWNSSMGEL